MPTGQQMALALSRTCTNSLGHREQAEERRERGHGIREAHYPLVLLPLVLPLLAESSPARAHSVMPCVSTSASSYLRVHVERQWPSKCTMVIIISHRVASRHRRRKDRVPILLLRLLLLIALHVSIHREVEIRRPHLSGIVIRALDVRVPRALQVGACQR